MRERILFLIDSDFIQYELNRSIEKTLTKKGCKFASVSTPKEYLIETNEVLVTIMKRTSWDKNHMHLSRGKSYTKLVYTNDFVKYNEESFREFLPCVMQSGELIRMPEWWVIADVAEEIADMVKRNWFKALKQTVKTIIEGM